jgi:hypothetical protein
VHLLKRHTFPYVMAMLGDGIKSYDNDKDGSEQQFAGCEVKKKKRRKMNVGKKIIKLCCYV